MYGYFRTYRTHSFVLVGLCLALFSVSSVAQQLPPGQGVSVDWSPTTSHWQTNGSTFRTPPGVTTSSSTAVGPVTRLPNGGAAQPMGSGITITSIERTGPVSSILRTGPAALRTAVTRCFGNPLCTLTVTGAALGLQELLDRTNWTLDDQGMPSVISDTLPDDVSRERPDGVLRVTGWNPSPDSFDRPVFVGHHNNIDWYCAADREYSAAIPVISLIGVSWNECFYGNSRPIFDTTLTPLPISEVSDAVDQHYDFHPSDWPVIGPHIPLNSPDVDIEITSAPSLTTPPVTTTQYDADGVPHTITETNIDYSFAPRPGTNPGPKPALDLEETTTTTSSTADGTVTGSQTTTTTRPAGDTTPGTGSGDGSTPETPWPAFCDWASVVCGWLNWTQEGWDQEEPDLPQLIDFVPEGDYQVGGPGECPAPYTINLGWMLNTSLEVSYQPFCDFAGLVKPLFLAFCYLFAGALTVRSL